MTSACLKGRYREATRTEEQDMGQVIASASMSLDGYIAKDDNTIGRLFDWLQNGPVEIPTVNDRHHPPPEPAQRRVLEAVARWAGCSGVRAHAVRLHRRLGRHAHDGRTGGRRDSPDTDGLGRSSPRRPVPLRHRRGGGRGGEGSGHRRRAHRGRDGRHHRPAVPRARPARRGRRRPGARGHGQGPSLLR